jgi:hypothetical protein
MDTREHTEAEYDTGGHYHPQVLSRYWQHAVNSAGLRPIKLHAARRSAATAMHLAGTPVAVIAAWIGHKDASLTMKLYPHSQDYALKAAGATRLTRARDRYGTEPIATLAFNADCAGETGADDGNRTRVFSLGIRSESSG